jgi:hypothetical protein
MATLPYRYLCGSMYVPVSRKFTMTLEERQYAVLSHEAERSSVAVAELIRRAIDESFGLRPDRRSPGVGVTVGVWRRPDAAVLGRRPGVSFER